MQAAGRGDEQDSASCSSSIGRNSDCSWWSDGDEPGEPEVQSALKGPLDTMDALEDSLLVGRCISKFYGGKSKSFTSLADASPSSSMNLAKQEKAYPRKRKNLPAFYSTWDRRLSDPLRTNSGSMPKRLANSRQTMFSQDRGASSSDSNSVEEGRASSSDSNSVEEGHEPSQLHPWQHLIGKVSPTPYCVSPPHGCYFSVRSFSLTDLQGASTCGCSSSNSPKGMIERLH